MPDIPHDIQFALSEFDRSQLPESQRELRGEAFREAVRDHLVSQFAGHGGAAQVAVTEDRVIIRWKEETTPTTLAGQAAGHLREGETDKGIGLLRVALDRNPDDTDALYNLGMALGDRGEVPEAIALLEKLVALDPEHPGAWIALGVAYGRDRRWDDAIGAFRQAVDRDPKDGLARKNLGAALAQSGELEAALEHLKAAVVLMQEDSEAWLNLATALERSGDTAQAETTYRRVIALNPGGSLAERAEQRMNRISSERLASPGNRELREDAVDFLVDALKRFDAMTDDQIRDLTFEIATLGAKGLSITSPEPVHTLRSLPGEFSGLQLLCLEYAGFQRIDPSVDIGIDLSAKFAEAERRVGRGR